MSECAFCKRGYEGDLCPRCSGAVDVDKVLGLLDKASKLPPREIGRFRIVRPIGEGGTGIVYEALDPVLSRAVALKILKPQGLSRELVERFLREARFLARLRHPNVVQILELGRHEGRDFLTMEFIEGKPFPATADRREALARLVRVARAIAHIHRRSIVHRDLKPSNILVDPGGRPVVMDFGIARSAEAVSTLSLSGTLVGTPAYMAPEQFLGETADAPADIYSLGVILYEVLAGRRPFDGKTVVALAEQVKAGHIPPLPDVPRALEAICRRAMRVKPEERYPTADAFADDLERILSGRRRRLPPWAGWAAAGAAAGLLAVLALAAWPKPDKTDRPIRPAPPAAVAADHVAEGRRLSLLGRFEEAHAAFDRAGAEAVAAKGELTLTQHFALHADRLVFPETVRALAARLAATQGPAFDRLAASNPLARFYARVARGQWEEAKALCPADDVLRAAVEFFADGRRGFLRRDTDGVRDERDVWRAFVAAHELKPVLARFPNAPGPRRTSTHAALLRLEAQLHEGRGDKEKALDALTRAVETAPDFLLARLALARLKRSEEELAAGRRQAREWGLPLAELDSLLR